MGVFVCMRVCVYAHGGKTMGVFVCMCVWGLCFCVYGVCAQGQILKKQPSKKCPRRAFWIALVAIFGPERPGAALGSQNAKKQMFLPQFAFPGAENMQKRAFLSSQGGQGAPLGSLGLTGVAKNA